MNSHHSIEHWQTTALVQACFSVDSLFPFEHPKAMRKPAKLLLPYPALIRRGLSHHLRQTHPSTPPREPKPKRRPL